MDIKIRTNFLYTQTEIDVPWRKDFEAKIVEKLKTIDIKGFVRICRRSNETYILIEGRYQTKLLSCRLNDEKPNTVLLYIPHKIHEKKLTLESFLKILNSDSETMDYLRMLNKLSEQKDEVRRMLKSVVNNINALPNAQLQDDQVW